MIEIVRCNKYEFPAVSISDSIISNIQFDDNIVVFKFNKMGFWIKKSIDDIYHRVKDSELVLYDCDVENIDIFILIEKEIHGEKYRVKKYLEFDEFAEIINKNIWRLEVIQEYKSDMGSLFVGRIRGESIKGECYLQIDYKQYGFKYDEE